MKYTIELFENLMKNKVSHNFIFTLDKCQPCLNIKNKLEKNKIEVEYLDFNDNAELAEAFGIKDFPSLIMVKNGGYKFYTGDEVIIDKLIKKLDDSKLDKAE